MTEAFSLNFEWQRPDGIQGPELRATWARLEIRIGEQCLTRVFDHKSRTVRPEIYIPLYPLAEWIAWNWWSLLYEPEVSWLRTQRSYSFRHNLRSVGDGIAMPNAEFRPLGRTVQAEWQQSVHPYNLIDFISQGRALLDRNAFFEELYGFVESVITRLAQENVTETILEQSWEAIRNTLADPDESDFCRAIALQGKDPYALSIEEENRVIETARIIPESLLDDFLLVGSWENLQEQAESLNKNLAWIAQNHADWKTLRLLRNKLIKPDDKALPWDQGYKLARDLRQALHFNGSTHSTVAAFTRMLELPEDQFDQVIQLRDVFPGMEALVGENKNQSPGFVLRRRGKQENQVFSFCRALCDYFFYPHAPSLISSGNTERQKRNRAFAAEFLAPSELIREHLSATEATPEDIEEIAYEMGVSSYVILHQVQNHGLATVYLESQ